MSLLDRIGRDIRVELLAMRRYALVLTRAPDQAEGGAQRHARGAGKAEASEEDILGVLQKMMKHETASMSPARHPVRALVLTPTRELADQVANNVKTYARHTLLRSTVVFGGIDMKPQTLELKAGVQRSRGTFDNQTYLPANQLRRAVGDNTDRGFTQAGKFGQLLGEDHSLTVGWDLEWRRREEDRTITEGDKLQLPDFDGQPFGARITRQALFVQDEWELSPQWSTYLGLRSERITTNSGSTGAPVRNTSSVTSPLLDSSPAPTATVAATTQATISGRGRVTRNSSSTTKITAMPALSRPPREWLCSAAIASTHKLSSSRLFWSRRCSTACAAIRFTSASPRASRNGSASSARQTISPILT